MNNLRRPRETAAGVAGVRALLALALILHSLLAGGLLARSAESGFSADQETPARPATGQVHYVVGISPFLSADARNEAFRHVVRFAVEDLSLDSTLTIYDAYRLRTITRMVVPNVRAFESSRTRLNQFADAIQATRRFLARTNARPHAPGLTFDGAMRLPRFLDFVADNLLVGNQRVVVVLLGNPLHQDEQEPAYSMVNGYFPSDGHLLASREKSVFGLADRGRRLAGVAVHFGYFGDPWVTELHRDRVTRFWKLFVEGQGGRWAACSGDLPTVFQVLRREPPAPATELPAAPGQEDTGVESVARAAPVEKASSSGLDSTRTKIEMLRISRDVGATDWITGDVAGRLAQGPPSTAIGPLKIGIRWQGGADLDLYAKAGPTAERLYFEHARSAEGYYFKDHRSSPDREYEFIEFTEPVDIRSVEARVNFHEGRAPAGGLDGEARVEFEGRIYSTRFHFDAAAGNRGREGAGQAPFWCRLDLPALLKLR